MPRKNIATVTKSRGLSHNRIVIITTTNIINAYLTSDTFAQNAAATLYKK